MRNIVGTLIYLIKSTARIPRAIFWQCLYFFPSRKLVVIFVTGTDGKTTTSNFIYNILRYANFKVGIISTIYANDGEKSYDTGFHVSTPGPRLLNKFLSLMVKNNCRYVVVEATSHAIDQYKLLGIKAKAVVLTNVNPEHLDYHRNYETYLYTKAKLLAQSEYAVINKNDLSTDYLIGRCERLGKPYSLFSSADVEDKLSSVWKKKFPGDYNLENAAAAYKVALYLGILQDTIIKSLEDSNILDGRFNIIHKPTSSFPFTVAIDFAHTPNAFERLLTATIKDYKNIILVFGAAAKRDKLKRSLMGEIAARYTKASIITAEDPRNEDVHKICKSIEVGFIRYGKLQGKDYFVITDRTLAIEYAIKSLASKEDLVLVTGKGHETSMCFGNREVPWSDKEVILEIIKD